MNNPNYNTLVVLSKRQKGLEGIRVKGYKAKVFDNRYNTALSTNLKLTNPNDIWYMHESLLPIYEDRFVVSGLFPEGHFHYSCCGSRESDPEYVSVTTNETNLDAIALRLSDLGASDISFGRELNKRKALDYALNQREKSVQQEAERFFQLSQEEQRKELLLFLRQQ